MLSVKDKLLDILRIKNQGKLLFKMLKDPSSHFNLANLFTFVNITMGVISLYFVAHHLFFEAIVAIWIGGAFDIFDGKIARKFHLSNEFGIQIDSFADFLSFVIIPTFLVFEAIFTTQTLIPLWVVAVIFVYYVISGLRRLIQFNIDANEGEVSKYFTGVPTPLGGIFLWIIYMLFSYHIMTDVYTILVLVAITGYLLNSNVKIRHP